MQDDKIKEIVNKLVSDYQPEKIILFGSYASGQTHRWSDVDLALIKDTNKRFCDRIGEALRILRSIDHKPPLDIIVYTPFEFEQMSQSNYFVQDEILKKGKMIYGQKEKNHP